MNCANAGRPSMTWYCDCQSSTSNSRVCLAKLRLLPKTTSSLIIVRPDMRYCFRFGRCRPNPRTKHISVPPRHMTKSYIPDFNMVSHHYRYKDTTSHTSGIQVPEYNTTAEDTCLSTDYKQCLAAKVKHTEPTSTRVQALLPGTPS